MFHFDVNWLAVVLAAVASMALGMAWYTVLSKQWIAATGKSRDELPGAGRQGAPIVWAAICQLVMAYFIALITPPLTNEVTVTSAILVGVNMWVGFIITAMILNHRYQNRTWMLTVIDGGYLLGVVIVQGLVIGVFG